MACVAVTPVAFMQKDTLRLTEIFYSLQGEARTAGLSFLNPLNWFPKPVTEADSSNPGVPFLVKGSLRALERNFAFGPHSVKYISNIQFDTGFILKNLLLNTGV